MLQANKRPLYPNFNQKARRFAQRALDLLICLWLGNNFLK